MWKRLPVAAVVLLVHLPFLALLQIRQMTEIETPPRETILTFPLLPRPVAVPETPQPAARPAQEKSSGTFIAPAQPFSLEQNSPLNLMLYSCGPENLGNLSPEQLARCRSIARLDMNPTQTAADFGNGSKAKHADKYAAAVAEKQAPLQVPCMYTANPPHASSPAIMVNPICAVGTISDVIDRILRGDTK